jgi:hypothetical protein
MSDQEWGVRHIWTGEDSRVILHWKAVELADGDAYITWHLARPLMHEQPWPQDDVIISGVITQGRCEWETVGALDMSEVSPAALQVMLESVLELRRNLP